MIRTGRSLFTAHTNADSANPGCPTLWRPPSGSRSRPRWSRRRARPASTSGSSTCPTRTRKRCRRRCLTPGPATSATTRIAAGPSPGSGSSCRTRGPRPRWAASATSSGSLEDRFEVVAPARVRAAVLAALRAAHPYEEPAFDIFAMVPTRRRRAGPRRHAGPTGTVARLRLPRARRVAADVLGVRAAGDPDMPVSRVAVCGGAGDSLLAAAAGAGVQAYVTADLRHHPPTSTAAPRTLP